MAVLCKPVLSESKAPARHQVPLCTLDKGPLPLGGCRLPQVRGAEWNTAASWPPQILAGACVCVARPDSWNSRHVLSLLWFKGHSLSPCQLKSTNKKT